MLEFNLIGSFLVQIAATTLAAWVAGRAWRDRPARMFALIVAGYSLINLGSLVKIFTNDTEIAYASGLCIIAGLGTLEIGLVLMFSSIFTPNWWKDRRIMTWIAAPFVLLTGLAILDGTLHTRLLIQGITVEHGRYLFERTQPLGTMMFVVFAASWLVPLGILVTAYFRYPKERATILMLVFSIVLSAWLGPNVRSDGLGTISQMFSLVQMLPVLAALAYMAGRTHLLEPTRAALDVALHSMSEMIAVIDGEGKTIYANRQAKSLGVAEARPIDQALTDAGASARDIASLFTSHAGTPRAMQLNARQMQVSLTPIRSRRGELEGGLIMGRDVTELEERNRMLEHLASHDALTDLPNRRELEAALKNAVGEAQLGQPSVLLFIDLDQFKIINDTLGHAAGDELLVRLSSLLQAQLAPGDLLTRLGGDEFAVITTASHDAAHALAERCLAAVEHFRFERDGQGFRLGLSIGLVPVDGTLEAEALLAQADITMYAAKGQGGNRVAIHEPDSDHLHRLSSAHQWAARVRDALRENRFELHYQPIVSLQERRVSHFEALLRLREQSGELVPPGKFIGAAERFGLMPQLDRWVALRALEDLRAHPEASIFINLSAASLDSDSFINELEAELNSGHVDPRRIGFEITETADLHDNARAARALGRLKALGCKLALDDFGVGFTSFAYLRQLPVDVIKIDGSFIRTLDTEPENRAIVLAMHRLARSLGKETVAEWVESERIQAVALELGLTHGQGFWLGRPVASLGQVEAVPA